ncbi:MAG: HTH domain-containing protein [Planctomycetes bacterium]|nr:HTH domain-containing protein [Planctomycetota bacterium]
MANALSIDGDQLARLSKLCKVIQSADRPTAEYLTTKLKASRRTIFRDLTTLAEFGIKVDSTSKGYKTKLSPKACQKQIGDKCRRDLADLLRKSLK